MSDNKTSLMKVEAGFTGALKPRAKCLFCTQKTAVTIMCSLLILSVVYHFGVNVMLRWGKPCFIWWEHWATVVTFGVGAIARLAVLPLAVLALLDTKKPVAETKFLRLLFHALLVLAALQLLDVLLCIFEVNEVCESPSMTSFDDCAYEYSRYAPDAPVDLKLTATEGQVIKCPAACISDAAGLPTTRCDAFAPGLTEPERSSLALIGCVPNPGAGPPNYDWSSLVCSTDVNAAVGRTGKFRAHRDASDQASFCEWFSTLYDVGFGIVFAMVTVAFAWSINSYRQVEESGMEMESD